MIIGHQNIISYLEKSFEAGRLPHALIFAGPKNIGKTTVARWLAAKLLQTEAAKLHIHPDMLTLEPEDDSIIKKEKIEQALSWLWRSPLGGAYKVLLVNDVHLMLNYSANTFLKALEEPPKNTVIILLTPQLGKLLPTIVSRAAVLHFKPVPKDNIRQFLKDRHNCADAKNFANLAGGRPGRAINALANPDEMNYAPKAEEFYKLFFGPTAERFAAVNNLLGPSALRQAQGSESFRTAVSRSGQSNCKKSDDHKEMISKRIDFWLEIIRDACFFKYNLNDSIVYAKPAGLLEKMVKIKPVDSLAVLGGKLIRMRSLIANNINIKLMLENLII